MIKKWLTYRIKKNFEHDYELEMPQTTRVVFNEQSYKKDLNIHKRDVRGASWYVSGLLLKFRSLWAQRQLKWKPILSKKSFLAIKFFNKKK